ncbi:UDP-N-acetylglucosamine 2-epimerase (non-hydrolysing) [Nonlabens dokdonensis]|jgi:UDP-N-acetylglucosamine 2-epimerase (non-hydrolysing)|uniref:UDP-N-acetylglucosamine 2-epimerase n=2 Tax=Nonlabens dokdonensis TaxID=328515 RepID=L7WEF5_NONDD|nr:UDP-N-acetylglucosamine 2-epimerase (non-hydrolyzing) [Nonlabens dokdonensis]AGC78667.1 UDP-N-acetylglucosamine 2-epimerase [Nonlabens dokdonensis DSW-6]PZX39206.1 UDP-N-acetylglucosamine 2-epimerase (non-hydrolysing) [Nonlabens dokdonensis]
MKKLKVATVVGTRPEIIRLSRVLAALDASPAIEHTLIHTGQNYDYELNQIFFDDLGLRKPDYFLEAAGKNAAETVGNIMIKIDVLLEKLKPEAFLVLGDTNSCLCAIPAKKRQIPIFHMEAGNRCFDQRVPEETNRKIVDHTADVNLTYSDIAREYLLREGLPADRIIKTGSPMFEVLNYYMKEIKESNVLKEQNLENGKYFVISAHRQENINSDRNFFNLFDTLNEIAEKYNYPIIFSTHPRTKNRIDQAELKLHENIKFLKPLGFNDYNHLQANAFAVLSDSGTISEESSILNFRALNIREAHERPEAMEEGAVMMVGLEKERIIQGLEHLQFQDIDDKRNLRLVSDYSMPNVSEKVVRIIISYTDYIKKVVWRE